ANTIIAGLLIWVAEVIAVFGLIICCVGFIFTAPYGAAIVAGIVTWYEQITGGASAAPPSAPLAPQPPPPPPPAVSCPEANANNKERSSSSAPSEHPSSVGRVVTRSWIGRRGLRSL